MYIKLASTFQGKPFSVLRSPRTCYGAVFWTCVFITGLMLAIHMTLFTKKVEETDRVMVDAPAADKPPQTFKEKLKELPFLDFRFMSFIFIL